MNLTEHFSGVSLADIPLRRGDILHTADGRHFLVMQVKGCRLAFFECNEQGGLVSCNRWHEPCEEGHVLTVSDLTCTDKVTRITSLTDPCRSVEATPGSGEMIRLEGAVFKSEEVLFVTLQVGYGIYGKFACPLNGNRDCAANKSFSDEMHYMTRQNYQEVCKALNINPNTTEHVGKLGKTYTLDLQQVR